MKNPDYHVNPFQELLKLNMDDTDFTDLHRFVVASAADIFAV